MQREQPLATPAALGLAFKFMIYVNRKSIPEPPWFGGQEHMELEARLEDEFRKAAGERSQKRIFDMLRLRKVVFPALLELFHNKCAYCERWLDASETDLDNFRPKQLGGDEQARDHYWWLAYSWDNLLPACAPCSRSKRNLFPILGKRCAVGAVGDELETEKPLLIDPTLNRPERLLIFEDSGEARAAPLRAHERARAETTIQTLQLNRSSLVEGRQQAAQQARMIFQDLRAATSVEEQLELLGALSQQLDNKRDFAAARRFACARLVVARRWPDSPSPIAEREITRLGGIISKYVARLRQRPVARSKKVHAKAEKPVPVLAAVVTQVVLRQFREIQLVKFQLSEKPPDDLVVPALADFDVQQVRRETGWKVLLGENGTGKTSILHAIAIALMGQDFYESQKHKYGLEESLRKGVKRGSMTVTLSSDHHPIVVRLVAGGIEWVRGADGANVFLRGYGASRLLPMHRPEKLAASPQAAVRKKAVDKKKVDNLFDPYSPLVDAENWLRQLGNDDFLKAAINIKDLLDIRDGQGDLGFEHQLREPRQGRFGLRSRKRFTPLEHFSAGYQTLLALACDIMAGTGTTIDDMREAPGVILLDEIGTNLHPRWRMEIVERLGRTFPRMQFIASTHEPLCLRGLGRGEVAVLQRDGERINLIDELPSPAGLRVDQLLTSEFFGLYTTIDPDTERAFGVYYDLLARQGSLSDLEQQKLAELRDQLKTRSVLGSSRRDRIILDIVDKFLAQSTAGSGNAFPKPSGDVRQMVEDALKRIEPPDDTLLQ